jgi:serine/threonine protein kinase
MLFREKCGKEVDFWGLGVLAYELSNFCPPFKFEHIVDEEIFRIVIEASEKNRRWHNMNLSK